MVIGWSETKNILNSLILGARKYQEIKAEILNDSNDCPFELPMQTSLKETKRAIINLYSLNKENSFGCLPSAQWEPSDFANIVPSLPYILFPNFAIYSETIIAAICNFVKFQTKYEFKILSYSFFQKNYVRNFVSKVLMQTYQKRKTDKKSDKKYL